jgi:Raf kinase inhibitor-like YbhB/YbcL family protein
MTTKRANALLLTTALAMAALFSQRTAIAADAFALASTTFKDGALLPKKVGNNTPGSANCVGENISPQLSWSGAPAGTRSFALTVMDAEGHLGAGLTHWIAYGIPADIMSFAEGEVSRSTDNYVAGKSDVGVPTFGGPCPPPGSPHHYTFLIIATDLDPKDLPPGLTVAELQAKLAGHEKGAAGLVGSYVNPYPN